MAKFVAIAIAAAFVLMPKLDSFELPELGFPFVTTAVAAEAGEEYSGRS